MKTIMYHYVRKGTRDLPFFRYLDADNFKKQLDFFEAKFGFVNFDEFLQLKKEPELINELKDKVLLSFDDGLKDHIDFVLPELLRRGIFGLFFIPTGVYERKKALDVHRIHYLLGMAGGGALMSRAKELIKPHMLEKVAEFSDKTYTKQDNDAATTEFKKLFNYYIKYEFREGILDTLVREFSSDEAIFNALYMSEGELKKMHENKMILGSHSIKHLVLSKLSEKEQEHEIRGSFDFLQQLLGGFYVKCFCYPYGGFHTFTPFTERLLSNEGVSFSFNVESRDTSLADIKTRPQALPRFDCNEFEYGRASLG